MKKERAGKKNLLIYAHYYIPDTASTGQILRELAEGMLDKFNITVICVVPSYLGTIEDKYKGVSCPSKAYGINSSALVYVHFLLIA